MVKGHLILNTSWILHHYQKVVKRGLWVFLLEVLAVKEWAMWDGKNCCCFCFCRWTERIDATGAIRAKNSHMCSAVERLNFIKKLCLTTRTKTEVLVPYVLQKKNKQGDKEKTSLASSSMCANYNVIMHQKCITKSPSTEKKKISRQLKKPST